jgi:predicted aconitase
VHKGILATIFTSRKVLRWVDSIGLTEKLIKAGFQIYTDGCLLTYPQFINRSGTMMTNSAKAANYIYSQSGFLAAYGSIRECFDSAVSGKIMWERPSWMGF